MDGEIIKKAFAESFKREFEKIAIGWLATAGLHVGLPLLMGAFSKKPKPAGTGTGAGRALPMTPR